MRFAIISVLSAALVAPIMVGCDKEVSHQQDQSTNPLTGNTTTTDKSTMQRPDGSTYQNSSQQTSPSH
jgi:hypothetical protein